MLESLPGALEEAWFLSSAVRLLVWLYVCVIWSCHRSWCTNMIVILHRDRRRSCRSRCGARIIFDRCRWVYPFSWSFNYLVILRLGLLCYRLLRWLLNRFLRWAVMDSVITFLDEICDMFVNQIASFLKPIPQIADILNVKATFLMVFAVPLKDHSCLTTYKREFPNLTWTLRAFISSNELCVVLVLKLDLELEDLTGIIKSEPTLSILQSSSTARQWCITVVTLDLWHFSQSSNLCFNNPVCWLLSSSQFQSGFSLFKVFSVRSIWYKIQPVILIVVIVGHGIQDSYKETLHLKLYFVLTKLYLTPRLQCWSFDRLLIRYKEF